jgi:hypothetical protein
VESAVSAIRNTLHKQEGMTTEPYLISRWGTYSTQININWYLAWKPGIYVYYLILPRTDTRCDVLRWTVLYDGGARTEVLTDYKCTFEC